MSIKQPATQLKSNVTANNATRFRQWVIVVLENPEKLFVVLAAIFSLAMVISMPLFMAPDEGVHFDRAYQVGQGHITSQTVHGITGGRTPVFPQVLTTTDNHPVPPIQRGHYFDRIPNSDIKFIAFPSSALYSPVGYMPQAIGIDIGKVIRPSVGTMIIGGRLCNLIVYIALVWLAIRTARHRKWVYAVAGLFPVAIQEAASLSTDVMTIGLAFVTIALIHNLFTQQQTITKRQCIALIVLALGLGFTKQTNLVLLFSLLFLPGRVFPSLGRRLLCIGGVIGIGLLAALSWYATIKLKHYEFNYSQTIGIAQIDQAAQLKYVITHPVAFAKTLLKTYVFPGFRGIALPDFFWVSMYGTFSLISYTLPIPFIFIGYLVLILAFLYSGHARREDSLIIPRLALLQTIVFVISLVAIAGALYLVWTPVGASQVGGIQGRYFIPILPLLIPLFILLSRSVKVTLDKPYRMGMIVSIVSIVNASAMVALTWKYF